MPGSFSMTPVSVVRLTRMGERETLFRSDASWLFSDSRSAVREDSSDSSRTIWVMSLVWDISARMRSTLACMVLRRASVSMTCWETLSVEASRRMSVPRRASWSRVWSSRAAGTEIAISP